MKRRKAPDLDELLARATVVAGRVDDLVGELNRQIDELERRRRENPPKHARRAND